MNITTRIIITDTNVITDLDTANILEDFIKLDNVYISDMVKSNEINTSTGNINLIKKMKEIKANQLQVSEIINIQKVEKKLSIYDIINFILARDNNAIIATGDRRLKNYSESHNVQVIRTLKIIELMENNNYISKNKAIQALQLLKQNNSTRIPEDDINKLISKIQKDSVTN